MYGALGMVSERNANYILYPSPCLLLQEEVKGALGQVTLAMENLMGRIFHASEVASKVATRETATSSVSLWLSLLQGIRS